MNKNNFVLPEIKDNNMYKNFITEDTIFEDAKYDEEPIPYLYYINALWNSIGKNY